MAGAERGRGEDQVRWGRAAAPPPGSAAGLVRASRPRLQRATPIASLRSLAAQTPTTTPLVCCLCRSLGASAGAELAADLSAAEAAIHQALASVLEVKGPVSRWPIYVFTGGLHL